MSEKDKDGCVLRSSYEASLAWHCQWRTHGYLDASPENNKHSQIPRYLIDDWLAQQPEVSRNIALLVVKYLTPGGMIVEKLNVNESNLFAILLCGAVTYGQRTRNEVILNINHDEGTDRADNLQQLNRGRQSSVFCFYCYCDFHKDFPFLCAAKKYRDRWWSSDRY